MNINKIIATFVVKNHNNSENMNKRDADVRNRIYGRISGAIELAKTDQLKIDIDADKFIICKKDDDALTFKPIPVYKRQLYSEEISNFFFGLKRSTKPNKYLGWYKHSNSKKYLAIIKSNGGTSVNVVDKKDYPDHNDVLYSPY